MSYAAIGPATGFLVDTRGLNVTFGILGILTTILFVVILVPLARRMRELQVDYIAPE